MRYFAEIIYNGTFFKGSQIQQELPTVQLAINKALSTLLRQPVVTFGASRTDEGVHALCNFYHFDTDRALPPHTLYQLNSILPASISVSHIYEALQPESNARFDALSRQYRYRIYNKKDPFLHQRAYYYPFKIDFETLQHTAAILKEYKDFETFSKRNSQTFTHLCTILDSRWERHEEEIHYIVAANRFLRGMVRALVGTQLQVARGRISITRFREIIEEKDCRNADFSVAGHGLYLEKIVYPEGLLHRIQTRGMRE